MGMSGNYIAIEDLLIKQIIDGDMDILDIEPKRYETLHIDKSWQAIHFLLCNDTTNGEPPMGYVVPMIDDNAIDCEFDYGAFYIRAAQVKEASGYLNSLDDNTLKEMYDFKSMRENEIYPLVENDENGEFYEYIHSYVLELKKYFNQTAEKGYGMIFFII